VHNIWVTGKGTAHLRRISGWVGSFEESKIGEKKFKENEDFFFLANLNIIFFS
jgi:hypothetical protein